jgi:cytochrome c oxidase cbb3-type subunit 3
VSEAIRTTELVPDVDDGVEDRLLGHDYDGIREYDNPLPGWWKSVFYATILFSGFYALYFHVVGWGATPEARYAAAKQHYETTVALSAPSGPAVSEAIFAAGAQDGGLVERGAGVFAARCKGCHGDTGAGLIGPNLTDTYQLHGSTRMDIYQTVRDGVQGTAMPAWGEQLSGPDLVAVVTFAITLRGKNLPGKEHQGVNVGGFR